MKGNLTTVDVTKAIFFLYSAALIILFINRLLLNHIYSGYFYGEVDFFQASISALRFDIQTASYLLIIPTLLLLLPLPTKLKIICQHIALHLSFILLVLSVIVLAGDTLYFGIVCRHAYHDLGLLLSESAEIFTLLINDYTLVVIACTAFILISSFVWLKVWPMLLIKKDQPHKRNSVQWIKQLGIFTLSLPVMLLMLRGIDIESKPLGLAEAYQGNNEQQANLILNGIYTAAKGLSQGYRADNYSFYSADELEMQEKGNTGRTLEQPFTQAFTQNTPNKRNVIIIMLESVDYKYIDALAGNHYGATPFLDQLTTKSEVYDNFYAAGQRSYYGMQATLFGLPPLHGVGYIGGGLELSRLSKIGEIANNHNYETFMIQSSKRESIRLDSIASYAQFTHYLGKSDIPLLRDDYPNASEAEFGWDYEMLMKNLDLVNRSDKPFLSFAFTGTTHQPFAEPPKAWQLYPHGENTEHDFLNNLRYTDESLKVFFDKAKQQPWYTNTTFIILADHTRYSTDSKSLNETFHIPLWIYKPGLNIPAKRHQFIASQLDILPTVIDALGFPDTFSAMGKSLFRERDDYSPIVKGNLIGSFTSKGNVLTTGKKMVSEPNNKGLSKQEALAIEKRLKIDFQLAYQAIKSNTWCCSIAQSLSRSNAVATEPSGRMLSKEALTAESSE
jgi:phosphoglycerol transferase MdoB-like AlkP superfamily enzyme